MGEARFGSEEKPGGKGKRGDGEHRGHEPRGDAIGERLNRRAAPLRSGDHVHDASEHRFISDPLGAHEEAAGAVERAAGDGVAGGLLDGDRFAREHGLIDTRAAFEN